MKTARQPLFKSVLFLAAISGFLFAAMPNVLASAEDQIDNALAASKAWLAQIDAGQYDESYAFGSEALQEKGFSQDKWTQVLKTFRTSWGPMVSRKQISHIYKPNGWEGSEGEFMIITYDTSFKRLGPATETVVLKWEDGQWRGAGYNAEAKPSPDDDSTPAPPSNPTETHTDPHMKPLPQ